jgi:hypothetical protein
MKWLIDILIFLFRTLVYRQAARGIQKKGVLFYLKSLQVIRKTLAGSIFVFLFLQTMVIGFIGSLVVGIFLLPEDLNTKLWVLLGVFSAFFILPMICLIYIFSEKVWYRLSGAEQMMSNCDGSKN